MKEKTITFNPVGADLARYREIEEQVSAANMKCGGTCCGGDHKCTCEVSEFKREPRYVVFKLKDIKKYLHPMDQQILMELGNRIAKGRREDVKPPLNAVVVEQDWPEFEMVWAAIEARMTPNG